MPGTDEGKKLYTLTEVSKKTGISMPTLQRYKKLYQARIPSEGTGRSQRYYESALKVFEELKKENIGRRGRPRKNAAAESKPKAAKKKKGGARKSAKKAARSASKSGDKEDLLTLTEIGKRTGISYPTLLRYVRMNLSEIPHEGSGRARRYKPEAVEVFKEMRKSSTRGRQPKAKKAQAATKAKTRTRRSSKRTKVAAASSNGDLAARLRELEKSQKQLERLVNKLEKQLNKPLRLVAQR